MAKSCKTPSIKKKAEIDVTAFESDEDARRRRLAEMIRRRQHTGTETGSTPNAPRDNS